ncbi:hypothetical protein GGE24_005465 [Bradyrhizobium centrosematis]|nr:hypothetical protein [Bradyrhizobium centrosematis]MCS3776109.1 hypothetical protein [Bradyrhizobium centrosematis]
MDGRTSAHSGKNSSERLGEASVQVFETDGLIGTSVTRRLFLPTCYPEL